MIYKVGQIVHNLHIEDYELLFLILEASQGEGHYQVLNLHTNKIYRERISFIDNYCFQI
jgi:hypothetical protein